MLLTEDAILSKLRKICLALPGCEETVTFGHPTFQIRKKTFCVLEEYKGELSLCVKVGKLQQGLFLDDARFYLTPYTGQHGWVSLKVRAAPLKWSEVKSLVTTSYRAVAPPNAAPKTA